MKANKTCAKACARANGACANHEHLVTMKGEKRKAGCGCKMSSCLKKYCKCYAANEKCGEACSCDCA